MARAPEKRSPYVHKKLVLARINNRTAAVCVDCGPGQLSSLARLSSRLPTLNRGGPPRPRTGQRGSRRVCPYY